MNRSDFATIVVGSLLLAGCGGSGGSNSGNTTASPFAGSYIGSFVSNNGDQGPNNITISSNGNISGSVVDNTQSNLTGTISGNVSNAGAASWMVTYSNGTTFSGNGNFTVTQSGAPSGLLTATITSGGVTNTLEEINAKGFTQWTVASGGNGHWYMPGIQPSGITWTSAEQLAEAMGGHMVTITSQAENSFVFSLISGSSWWFQDATNFCGPWIGATAPEPRSSPDTGWAWVTGEPWSYTSWATGEPINPDDAGNGSAFWNPSATSSAATWGAVLKTSAAPPVQAHIVEIDGYHPVTPSYKAAPATRSKRG